MARMKLETLGLKSLDSGFAALGKGAVAVGECCMHESTA